MLNQEIQIYIAFLYINSNSFNIFESLKIGLINMVAILMMPAKMSGQDLFKIKSFGKRLWRHSFCPWRHQQDLSWGSSYIADVVIWPKFGNSSNSMREVIIISIL